MLSDDGSPQALNETSLDLQGIDFHDLDIRQHAEAESIRGLWFSPQFLFACVFSLLTHGLIVSAVVYWWMQSSQQSFAGVAPSFQISINSPQAKGAESNLVSFILPNDSSSAPDQEIQIEAALAIPLSRPVPPQLPQPVTKDEPQDELISMPMDSELLAKDVLVDEKTTNTINLDLTKTQEKQYSLLTINQAERSTSPVSSMQKSAIDLVLLGANSLADLEKVSSSERKMIEGRVQEFIADNKNSELDNARIQWEEQGVSYHAEFIRKTVSDAMALEPLQVNVRRNQNGQQRFTEIKYKRLAFSNYAQVVNRWDQNVLISKDIFEGRFHSNTSIRIEPGKKLESIFLGRVSIATYRDPPRKRANKKFFEEQLELGAEKIVLPKGVSPLDGEIPPNESQIHSFSEDTTIRFLPDGQYEWSIDKSNVWQDKQTIHKDGSYLLAEKGVRLKVLGEVAGKVIVYSPERITVVGNIVYATDPREDPSSGDYLGLISEKNIEIAEHKIIGDGDLNIHGAIYAKRRFVVRRFRVRSDAKMVILGSVSAGSLSATEPRYATQVLFDQRLENNRPPLFPVTDQYELSYWDENWQQEP